MPKIYRRKKPFGKIKFSFFQRKQSKLVNNHGTHLEHIHCLPERCHGDDSVPKRDRYAGEFGVFHTPLGVKHHSGKDNDGHGQRKEQEAQLARAALQGVAENAQAL